MSAFMIVASRCGPGRNRNLERKVYSYVDIYRMMITCPNGLCSFAGISLGIGRHGKQRRFCCSYCLRQQNASVFIGNYLMQSDGLLVAVG